MEYKILRIGRLKVEKEVDHVGVFGRHKTEHFDEVEPWEDFDRRVETTLNELAGEGWRVINTSYTVPIKGEIIGGDHPDYDAAEYVILMSREAAL